MRLAGGAFPRLMRTGKCAFYVAENFRFDEVFWKRRAIYGHKWRVPALADFVDSLGRDFLPGSRFTCDENGSIRIRDIFDHFINRLHWRGIADKSRHGLFTQLFFERALRRTKFCSFQSIFNRRQKLLFRERFNQEIIGPCPHRIDSRIHRTIRRNHDKCNIMARPVHLFDNI